MAGVEIRSSKMSFLLVSVLVMVLSALAAVEDIVPLPPVAAPTHDYLEQCGTKLHPICGEEIKTAVFANGKISKGCCEDLLAEGRSCHDTFVQVVAPYYPESARSEVSIKGAQAWNSCETAFSKN